MNSWLQNHLHQTTFAAVQLLEQGRPVFERRDEADELIDVDGSAS